MEQKAVWKRLDTFMSSIIGGELACDVQGLNSEDWKQFNRDLLEYILNDLIT